MTDPNAQFILGEPIRIIGGKNKEHNGWLNASSISSNPSVVNIIVDLSHKGMGYKATWAKKKNIGPVRNIHGSYWEALLCCGPSAERKLNDAASELVECQIRDEDIKDATDYLENQIKAEKEIMKQMIKMGKAKVRPITHEPRKRRAGDEAEHGDPMESV